jgi:hypothetical protein
MNEHTSYYFGAGTDCWDVAGWRRVCYMAWERTMA